MMSIPDKAPGPSPHAKLVGSAWRQPLLLWVVLVMALLVGYQAWMSPAAPSWGAAVAIWLRMALVWQGVAVLLLVTTWLTRTHQPEALPWWLLTVSLLGYALGKTLQVLFDRLVFAGAVPFPWWTDGIELATFSGFFLAIVLWPGVWQHERTGLVRAKVLLDTLLVVGAITALSWYFFLAPLFLSSAASWQAKGVELAYPVVDLGGCFALVVVLLRPHRDVRHVAVLRLLLLTVGCLILADSWMLWVRLYAPHASQTVPTLLYVLAALLLPLAALVQYQVLHQPQAEARRFPPRERSRTQQDLRACFRLLLPLVIALVAGVALEAHMLFAPDGATGELVPHLVILLLVLLALTRQAVAFLDYTHVLREREGARANAHLWRDTTHQMETFLGIASHELKTPLTSLQGYVDLMALRLNQADVEQAPAEELRPLVTLTRTLVNRSEDSVSRLARLVNDLLDYSRIRQGRLEHRTEPCELTTIVAQTVEDQRQLAPARSIVLARPEDEPLHVLGDAERLGQVVTNLLTNALKYSSADRPVEVGALRQDQQGCVWVRDHGPGIPAAEQAHLWERFYRVPGVDVQYGSGVGLGLGLHICKTIVDQHGGQVGVRSVPGEGSVFWFKVPLTEDSGVLSHND